MSWQGPLALVNPLKNDYTTLLDSRVQIQIHQPDDNDINDYPISFATPEGEEILTLRCMTEEELLDCTKFLDLDTQVKVSIQFSSLGGYVKMNKLRKTLVGDMKRVLYVDFPGEDKFLYLVDGSRDDEVPYSDKKLTYFAWLLYRLPGEFKANKDLEELEEVSFSSLQGGRADLKKSRARGSESNSSTNSDNLRNLESGDPIKTERKDQETQITVKEVEDSNLGTELDSRGVNLNDTSENCKQEELKTEVMNEKNGSGASKPQELTNNDARKDLMSLEVQEFVPRAAGDSNLSLKKENNILETKNSKLTEKEDYVFLDEPKHLGSKMEKTFVPYFKKSEIEQKFEINNKIGTGQEIPRVRLIINDWQKIMFDKNADKIADETGSSIHETVLDGQKYSILSIAEGNPGLALKSVMDVILSDQASRIQDCFLIMDALSVSAVAGNHNKGLVRIQAHSGAVVNILDAKNVYFDVVGQVLPNEKILSFLGKKPAILTAADEVFELIFQSYTSEQNSIPIFYDPTQLPPSCSTRSLIALVDVQILIPIKYASEFHTMASLSSLFASVPVRFLVDRSGFPDYRAITVQGAPRLIREAIFIVFNHIVQKFCFGKHESLSMPVRLKEYQLYPQDLFILSDVALRSGCQQYSSWYEEDVTFIGSLYNILAALSYMIPYY